MLWTSCALAHVGSGPARATDVLASAAGEPAAVVEQIPTAPELATEPMYAAPTSADRAGRILAAVVIDGRGPYRFILDTGANRSALSSRLAAELGLEPAQGNTVNLHGVTGFAALPFVEVAALTAGDFSYDPGPLPILPTTVFADADGILGMEGFADSRIEVDFKANRVSIERSTGRRAGNGFIVIRARNYRGLLVVDGSISGVPVKAIVDTGAERTLGNAALRDALLRRTVSQRHTQSRVIGATEQTYDGTSFVVQALRLGTTRLTNLPITFGDMHVFNVWGLDDEPAVLVGMDLIGTLHRFAVDYKRSEIQLMPVGSARALVQRCGPTECRSRIPTDRT
jgi:predicted aspartyl protease